MALDQLLTVLRQEADTESASVLDQARVSAQAIREAGAAERADRQAAEDRRWDAERQQALALALAGAAMRAREAELLARDRLLARVLARARQLLPSLLGRPEYRAAIPALLAQGLECLGTRAGAVHASAALVPELEPLTAGRGALTLEADPSVGTGFQLRSADGGLTIDATLEHRLEQVAPRIRQELLTRLEAQR